MAGEWGEYLGVGIVFDVLAIGFIAEEIGRRGGGDVNGDGAFTLSDVPPMLLDAFAGPGRLVMEGLPPAVQQFLEYDGGSGVLPVLISLFVWACVACFVAWVCYQVRYTVFGPLGK